MTATITGKTYTVEGTSVVITMREYFILRFVACILRNSPKGFA